MAQPPAPGRRGQPWNLEVPCQWPAMAAAAQPDAVIVSPDTGDINAEPWPAALLPLVSSPPHLALLPEI